MRDFLGQELGIGDFAVAGARGNSSAEYGSILYRIKKFNAKSIGCERLSVWYQWTDGNGKRLDECVVIGSTKHANLSSPNRLTKVRPHKNQIKVFNNPEKYPRVVGKWLHGAEEIDWDKLSLI